MSHTFNTWNYHEKAIQNNKELKNEDKQKAIAGLQQIRRLLGEDFLEHAFQTMHPIVSYFRNEAPWTRLWLAEFGSMLSHVQDDHGFQELKERLISKEGFFSAISELETGYRFSVAGFSVEFYPSSGKRRCDLRVQKGDTRTYIEVTIIGPSQEERETEHTFYELAWSHLSNSDIEIAGKIYKALSNPRIAEIKRKITTSIHEARRKQECIILSEPRIIDIIICPKSMSSNLSDWLRKKGLASHFEGPSYNVDEIRRARKTLDEENRQLPKNEPGIVVLNHGRIFMPNSDAIERLVYELEEEVYKHSNMVAAVLVFTDVVGANEAGRHGRDFVWSRKVKYRLYGENTLVIKNKYSRFQVDEEIVSALIT